MRKVFVLLSLIYGLALTSCVQSKTEVYHDTNVVVKQKHAPLYPMNVHGGDTTYLSVAGKMYKGVRGMKPYYLELTNLHAILFVTEGDPFKVTFHVVNLNAKSDVQIDGDGSSFGWNIGSGRSAGDRFTDYIESVGSNKVVVATRARGWKEVSTLNVDTKSKERMEIFYYGPNDQVTNHVVR